MLVQAVAACTSLVRLQLTAHNFDCEADSDSEADAGTPLVNVLHLPVEAELLSTSQTFLVHADQSSLGTASLCTLAIPRYHVFDFLQLSSRCDNRLRIAWTCV